MSEQNQKAYDFLKGGEVTLRKNGKVVFNQQPFEPIVQKEEPKKKRAAKKEEPKKYVNLGVKQ